MERKREKKEKRNVTYTVHHVGCVSLSHITFPFNPPTVKAEQLPFLRLYLLLPADHLDAW